jgi:hypothetical protein
VIYYQKLLTQALNLTNANIDLKVEKVVLFEEIVNYKYWNLKKMITWTQNVVISLALSQVVWVLIMWM